MLSSKDMEKVVGNKSRYAMVLAVAKRARDICDDYVAREETLIEKPVSLAIEDFLSGKYKMYTSWENEGEK